MLAETLLLGKRPDLLYKNRFYGISRFLFARKTYSFTQSFLQKIFNPPPPKMLDKSIFEGFDITQCIEKINQDAVALGLQLPASMTEEILQYASQSFCLEPGYPRKFIISDSKHGCLPDGHQLTRALVLLPHGGDGVSNCPAIEKLVEDPVLLKIARAYLHYWPTRITRHLTWALVSSLPESEIKNKFPPTAFHFDIAGYNFMTAYFYITDVDADSGAHVMIKKSHRKKALSFLSSGRHPDKVVLNHYGQENQLVISGKRGFGFVQDPSCFHKVISPIKANRLLLQIRYS